MIIFSSTFWFNFSGVQQLAVTSIGDEYLKDSSGETKQSFKRFVICVGVDSFV